MQRYLMKLPGVIQKGDIAKVEKCWTLSLSRLSCILIPAARAIVLRFPATLGSDLKENESNKNLLVFPVHVCPAGIDVYTNL